MATRRDIIFAWVGVVVAALSAVALSGAVIIQQIMTDKANKDAAAQQQAVASCKDNGSEQPLPAPDIYKATGTVTSIQKTDLVSGSGQAAQSGDCLIVKYYGTLAANGTKFDENFTQATAFAFILGKGQVIPGWDQGLVGMKVGGTRRLVIPAQLAYGSQGSGSAIPPNSDLVFVVKLLRIQK